MPSLRGIRQWPARIPDALWTPLTAVGLVVVVGVCGVIADQPWLYPSLGPSALVTAEYPNQQAARFRDVVLGHLIGLFAGIAAVWLAGADTTALITREVSAERVLAAALAMTPGVWWIIDHQFAMNAFEPLFWTGLAFSILRLIKTGNP